MKIFRSFFVIAGIFFVLPVFAGTAPSTPEKIDAPFDRLQDNAWALVLTGPVDDPLFLEQIALLTNEAEKLIAREMVVIRFKDRSLKLYPELSVFAYQLPRLNENRDTQVLERQLFTDDDVFSVVLVGKDGVTKYVWHAVVRPEDIFHMMDHPIPMEPADQALGKQ